MNLRNDTANPVFDQAATWVARLEAADCSAAERASFEDWLAQDPAHVHAWVQADTLHRHAATLHDDLWLRASAKHIAAHRPRHQHPLFRVAAAAVLCLSIGGGWLLATDGNPTPHTYTNSGLATQPQILEDGSLVVLDAGSALTTRFGWRPRWVELQQGRMQLRVAAASRPMRVQAGNSTLRDIGTTFQVELLDDGQVGVALLDGALDVASSGTQAMHRQLRPGEQLRVRPSGHIEPNTPLLRQQADAWLHGQLLFDATPLSAAVAQMNRYTAAPLVIADPAIANLAVSGNFRAGDQAALLSALELGWSVGSRPRADGALELRGRQ